MMYTRVEVCPAVTVAVAVEWDGQRTGSTTSSLLMQDQEQVQIALTGLRSKSFRWRDEVPTQGTTKKPTLTDVYEFTREDSYQPPPPVYGTRTGCCSVM